MFRFLERRDALVHWSSGHDVSAFPQSSTMGSYRFRDVPATISPCGICRQVLREFCPLKMPIFLVSASYDPSEESSTSKKETLLETTLEALLPHSFGPELLELPRPG